MFEAFLSGRCAGLTVPGPICPFPPVSDREKWNAVPFREDLLAWGEEAREGYPMLPATAFLAYARTGDRQVFEKPYFERRSKLAGAILAECVQNDGAYMDAVVDGLWCILEETSWVISAHNGSDHEGQVPPALRPLPERDYYYIDLFAAQTAQLLSFALYFLKDRLDAVTPALSRRVLEQLKERILDPFLKRDDFWWMGVVRKDLNNWTPWILSNILTCVCVLDTDLWIRTRVLEKSMAILDRYLAAVSPDGGCDEGCAYWNMAGGALLSCLELIEAATGGAVSVWDRPLIRAIGTYPARVRIAGDRCLNFADCDLLPRLDGERIYTYGCRTGDAALKSLGSELLRALDTPRSKDTPQMGRVLLTLFCRPEPQPPAPLPAYDSFDALQLFIYRRKGMLAAVKGGHNGESHNHNDLGSVILCLDGEVLAADAGNMTYTAKTFSAERYTLWNTRSAYHSVPLFSGAEQVPGKAFRAKVLQSGPEGTVLDLTGAYPPESGLAEYVREMSVSDGSVMIRDHGRFSGEGRAEYVWMLGKEPVLSEGRCAVGGMDLVFSPALAPHVTFLPCDDPRMKRSWPGGLWRLVLSGPVSASFDERFLWRKRA